MTTSGPTFCTLAEVVDWAHSTSQSLQCAYLVNDKRLCTAKFGQKEAQNVQLLFESNLSILTARSGRYTQASSQFPVLQIIAARLVCERHGSHVSRVALQWLDEFNVIRSLIIRTLEKYYGYENDDTRTEEESEEKDKKDEPFSNESDGEYFEAQEQICTSEYANEGISTPPSQSPSHIGALRRTFTFDEDRVAKDVTWHVKQPIREKAIASGYVYIISPSNLPGKFKIGHTKDYPELNRLKQHRCYGDYNVIKTEYTPYAFRVEQLLLAEFSNKHFTLEDACSKHGVRHKELLEIDEDSLIESLEKWVKFAKSPSYDKKSGELLDKAKTRLPPPASEGYLKCGKQRRRLVASPGSKKSTPKKEADQDGGITPQLTPNFNKSPTPTIKSISVNEVELDSDGLASDFDDLQLSPSRNRRRVR
ncbi:hypothetical protein PMG11_10977 [Penicillium brasilianum]|uniref:Bacteriophage T5 Orf172 DNA-binding domain-containing protein n=1 Tax=Penicillium brasilianum TaxID=104259 RepID=A0A0F7U456_PENBI|nr:hypothetical protein PMG11_10977 [Penicillium brasilianum]